MKRNDAEQIGKLIRSFLRQESLESPLNERRLINSWAEVLGPVIASYTRELYIKNQVLYVHLLGVQDLQHNDVLVRHAAVVNDVVDTAQRVVFIDETLGLFVFSHLNNSLL